VFVGVYEEDKLKNLLNIPAEIRVVGLFPLGYPTEDKKDGPPRKLIQDFCFYELWGAE